MYGHDMLPSTAHRKNPEHSPGQSGAPQCPTGVAEMGSFSDGPPTHGAGPSKDSSSVISTPPAQQQGLAVVTVNGRS